MRDSSSDFERYDELMSGLKPLLRPSIKVRGRDLGMGSRTTPVLNVEDEKIAFSAFRPRNKKSQPYYSQSLLVQSLGLRQRGEISYPAPIKQIRLRRDSLTDETSSVELDEIETIHDKFLDVAYKLHPTEARGMGFSKNFVRRLKVRRVSHSLAKFLRIAET